MTHAILDRLEIDAVREELEILRVAKLVDLLPEREMRDRAASMLMVRMLVGVLGSSTSS